MLIHPAMPVAGLLLSGAPACLLLWRRDEDDEQGMLMVTLQVRLLCGLHRVWPLLTCSKLQQGAFTSCRDLAACPIMLLQRPPHLHAHLCCSSSPPKLHALCLHHPPHGRC